MKRFLIAAAGSGSGKTLITLGLLRAFRNKGLKSVSAKAGPDYIDPAFHAAASGEECVNLDPWAMGKEHLRWLSWRWLQCGDIAVVEGMMGLFDGAADGTGSSADLASLLQLPVVLVIDVSHMSFSIAALAKGFRDHRQELPFAGVILNKVGSQRHETMLRKALEQEDIAIFGAVPRIADLLLPSRHLGLVQAGEHEALDAFIAKAAEHVSRYCDLEALADLGSASDEPKSVDCLSPLAQHISVARDEAFSFCYPHLLEGWKGRGAELSFFSPLANEAPAADASAVYLPGGYPELHGERIASAGNFLSGLKHAFDRGAKLYGECGGYMVLGKGLTDEGGKRHAMAGLLDLETSFEARKLHLGYRRLSARNFPLGNALMAHEFHYTTALSENGDPLFKASDALGNDLGPVGLRRGNVMGSYMHVIDKVA